MTEQAPCHVLTVGWDKILVEDLADRISARSQVRFSHLVHPRHVHGNWPARPDDVHFFRTTMADDIPSPDLVLLESLERPGLPTIHTMIRSDRVLRELEPDDALGYATLLARRMISTYEAVAPDVIITGFDSLHASLGLAVARYLDVPGFALAFSTIPPGHATFCTRMTPASGLVIARTSREERLALAAKAHGEFLERKIKAHAKIEPVVSSLSQSLLRIPKRAAATFDRLRQSKRSHELRHTETRNAYDAKSAIKDRLRARRALNAIRKVDAIKAPPESSPFVLFGFHRQPESSVDVWAPFFSNQLWVVETLARSIPPTHKLLVKIHKSDTTNYSPETLQMLTRLPGVHIVEPFSDARQFIEKAALVAAIQGTMGLEAALLGKPVIMFGDSPVAKFRNAQPVGHIRDLPALVRGQLALEPPQPEQVIEDYATYLTPFLRASLNAWKQHVSDEDIGNYARLFETLGAYLANGCEVP